MTFRLLTSLAEAQMSIDQDSRFKQLVQRYGRLISSMVRRVAGRSNDLLGDDIEQKVLLALWRHLETEQEINYPSSYICRIAVREAVRMLRHEAARGRRLVTESEAEAEADSGPDPSQSLTRREQREAIEASLAELTQKRERALRAHLAGFTVDEIMEMYGWSYERVRNLITRGRADLRAALRRRGIHG